MQDDEDYWTSSDISQNKFCFDDGDSSETQLFLCNTEESIFKRIEDGHALSARYRSTESTSSRSIEQGVILKTSGNSTFYDEVDKQGLETKPLSAAEAAKLESEVRALRRALEDANKDRWTPIPTKQMIRRILMGKPYNLGDYKSKEMKLKLLEEALESCDGNAIITVVLCLKNTLKQSLFYQELRNHPEALNHYLIYLKNQQDFVELSDMLTMVDRQDEAALINYKLALRSRMVTKRLESLKSCITNHFKGDANEAFAANHVFLMEMQRPIQKEDARQQSDNKRALENSKMKNRTLLNAPVISTLHYLCLHHYDKSENHFGSPQNTKKHFQLSERQFAWTAMTALAVLSRWDDLEKVVITKTWLSGNKKFVINPERVLEVLQLHKADSTILNKFAKMIDNIEERLEVSHKFNCHETVVDTLVLMRDRQQLKAYEKEILPHTREYFYWHNAVNTSTIKWKN